MRQTAACTAALLICASASGQSIVFSTGSDNGFFTPFNSGNAATVKYGDSGWLGGPDAPPVSLGTITLFLATFSNGTQTRIGAVAMASFAAAEGLRPIGDAHWQSTGVSGTPLINQAGNGPLGTVRSGTLEAANIDLTEELVSLIAAQRNFQANAQALETANTLTQTIVNLQT